MYSNLLHMTRFWNNRHQVRTLIVKRWETQIIKVFGSKKNKRTWIGFKKNIILSLVKNSISSVKLSTIFLNNVFISKFDVVIKKKWYPNIFKNLLRYVLWAGVWWNTVLATDTSRIYRYTKMSKLHVCSITTWWVRYCFIILYACSVYRL